MLGGLAIASTVQELYERAFGLPSRGMKDFRRRCAWRGILVGGTFLTGWALPGLRHVGGPALTFAVHFVEFTLFWWFTMWFLLAGRTTWRYLFPAAVATGIFWTGMEIVFTAIFSGQVTSYYDQYGPIGIVFALMTYFIAIGVVLILGAVVDIVWRERQLSLGRAVRHLARRQ